MSNKRLGIIAAIGVAVVAAGVWFTSSRTENSPPAPAAIAVAPAAPSPAAPATPNEPAKPAEQTVAPPPALAEPAKVAEAPPPPPAPPKRPDMAVQRTATDTSKSQPELCLYFTQKLVEDGSIPYGDYLRFEPKQTLTPRVAGNGLCLGGLAYGKSYTLTVAKGVPAASGDRSLQDESLTVELGDRKPLVAFSGNGFVLPRQGNAGIAVDSVNVDRIRLTVLRVADRGLVRELRQSWSEGNLTQSQADELQAERGSLIWQGEMTVKGERNQRTTTLFPLAQVVRDRQPGAYLLIADNAVKGARGDSPWMDEYRPLATRWVIETDLGVTSYRGADGLRVQVRSLNSAQPVAGVRVSLLAVNNRVLAETNSDDQGTVTFAPGLLRGAGGDAPAAIMAHGPKDDFAFQDLARPAFDLSDRGVSGRDAPSAHDAFLYTDRGIYRPGETVHLAGLLRDASVKAVGDVPLTLIIRRPNGSEVQRQTVTPGQLGGFHLPITLPSAASRGAWTAEVLVDPQGKPVGRLSFDVQDFVPQRLKVMASSPDAVFVPGGKANIAIDGAFLYGAPAADLAGEALVKLVPDPAPWPALKDWLFGRVDDPFKEHEIEVAVENTDDKGHVLAEAALDNIPASTKPLKAQVTASLFEPGGRVARDRFERPVRLPDAQYVGLQPAFADDRIQEDSAAKFATRLVRSDGSATAGTVEWALVEERVQYQWYQVDGQWRYEIISRDRPLETGTTPLTAEATGAIETAPLPWGRYRLTLKHGSATTSYRFRAGWGGTQNSDTPDTLDVALDKDRYRDGDIAKVTIRPPTAGRLSLAVATDRILEWREVDVPAGGTTLEIPVKGDWGSGAYALATLYRPLTTGKPRDPVRAIGLAWMAVDPGPRKLEVKLDAPEKARPRQTLDVPVAIKGAQPGEPVRLTLAAVDEGILLLTRFASPAPDNYYFGKRRLAVELRDDYGRLLEGAEGQIGTLREGGDGIGGAGLPVVPTKSVALYSGIVTPDDLGRAVVKLDVPDFNGQLRLMAVAWSGKAVGRAEARTIIRDPLIGEVSLPRFLAPGDDGRLTLLVHNVEGPAGDVTVTLAASGAVELPTPVNEKLTLAAEGRKIETHALHAKASGIGTISLTLTGADGTIFKRDWQIAVRSPFMPITLEQVASLPTGIEYRPDPSLLEAFEPNGLSIAVNFGLLRGIDVAGLLQSLNRYPYGCSEQITSRALPLLAFADPLLAPGGNTAALREQVQQAIDSLLERQNEEGDFGLWTAGDSAAVPHVVVGVIDFLAQARSAGYRVPEAALKRGYGWITELIRDRFTYIPLYNNSRSLLPSSQAYGWYVLARAQQADIGDLRYFHDTKRSLLATSLGRAQLGAALALMGDKSRAANAFREAEQAIGKRDAADYYGSPLRDLAGLIALESESGLDQQARAHLTRLAEQYDSAPSRTTTQEQAWLLRAAANQVKGDPLRLSVNNLVEASTALPAAKAGASYRPDAEQVRRGFTITNESGRDIWRTLVLHGTPKTAPPPLSRRLTLEKKLLTLQGEPVDPTKIQQHQRLMVSLRGKAEGKAYRQLLLVDPLPAGWEIEAVVLRGEDGQSVYEFLPSMSVLRVREARDDRFVAALDVFSPMDEEQSGEYHAAYIARAVTPGHFVLPGAAIEDMYRPGTLARTATLSTNISAAGGK